MATYSYVIAPHVSYLLAVVMEVRSMYACHGLQLMYCTTACYHTSLATYAMLMVAHRSYSYHILPCILCTCGYREYTYHSYYGIQ